MGKPTRLNKRIQTIDPRIARTTYVERIRGRTLQKINERIKLRDEYTCQKCAIVTARGEVHHVRPLHLGGAESDSNRIYLCAACHRDVSDKEEQARSN